FARRRIRRDLRRGRTYPIAPFSGDLCDYDLVVLCSPVWEGRLSTPALAFARQYGAQARHLAAIFSKHTPEPRYAACVHELTAISGQANPVHLFVTDTDPRQSRAIEDFAQKLYRWLGRLTITLLPRFYSLCTLAAADMPDVEALPADAHIAGRTRESVQLACPMGLVPRGAVCEHNWRLLTVHGPLSCAQMGILHDICRLLAQEDIEARSFAGEVETTDYLLIRSHKLEQALEILRRNYYDVDNYTTQPF
ncbi:MAG: ACT domain-containing protein, partial [Eubacteriales bacterium]|nr:ACT domain-containing protein [Eubacteriales bacterium]